MVANHVANATISQVHRATFRRRGAGGNVEEVEGVVKVQHTNVRSRLKTSKQANKQTNKHKERQNGKQTTRL